MFRKLILFVTFYLSIPTLFGMDNAKPSVVVTLNALADWRKPGVTDFMPVLKGTFTSWTQFKAAALGLTLIPQFKAIKAEGKKVREKTVGMSNIVHELFDRMKVISGRDLTPLEDDIIKAAINIVPNESTIEILKKVTVPVYVAGIVQDSNETAIWLDQLYQYDTELKKLFSGKLTYRAWNDANEDKCADNHYLFGGSVVDGKIDVSVFSKSLHAMAGGRSICFVDVDQERIDAIQEQMPLVTGIDSKTLSLKNELKRNGLLKTKKSSTEEVQSKPLVSKYSLNLKGGLLASKSSLIPVNYSKQSVDDDLKTSTDDVD